MTVNELYQWITDNMIVSKNRKDFKEGIQNQVLIQVGGKERPLNQCKVENGKLILIG